MGLFFTNNVKSQDTVGFSFDNPYRKYINIPVKIVHNLIIVPVRINDSPPLNFLLDTGVKTTILSEPLLLKFIQPDSTESVLVLGLGEEGFILAERLNNIKLQMNGITGKNMNMIVLPEGVIELSKYLGFSVYGIIGYDFFKEFPVRINYSNSTIRIYKESNYRTPWFRTTKIPLEINESKPYVKSVIKSWDDKIDTLDLLVDLGASSTLMLNEEYCDFSNKHIDSHLGTGLSGRLLGKEGRIEEVSFQDISFENPIVAYPEEDLLFPPEANIKRWDGILGGGILSKFKVWIDYSENLLMLRKSLWFNDEMHSNMSGLEIIAEGIAFNKFKIDYVRPGSPADEANIKQGDYIISINEMPTIKLSMDEVISRLSSSPGDRVLLKLQRDNEIIVKRITLREDI